MSSDPNELIRLILAQGQQQRQQQQPQQQGTAALESINQQLQQLYQQLGPAAPALNASQPPSSLDALSSLVANLLQSTPGGGTNAAAPASNHGMHSLPFALAAQAISHNQSNAPQINNGTPSLWDSTSIHQQLSTPPINYGSPSVSSHSSMLQQQQELLKVAELLATSNPVLAAAAMERALAIGAQSHHQQFQVQQQQQQRGTQQQQEQDSKVTTSPIIAAATSSNTFYTKNNEDNDTLKKALQINRAQMSSTDCQENTAVRSQQGEPSAFMPARPSAHSRGDNRAAAASIGALVTNLKPPLTGSSSTFSVPVEPVSLLTLQSWNRGQLESYVKKLQENNQPIPNTVKIVLEDAQKREEKKHAKRMANRKSASTSRARKKQLIDELTAAHAKLRRHALILAYLPDPVIVIDTSGEIKFCSVQLERLLSYKGDDLVGSSIERIIMPDSRGAIRRLIQDLVQAERHAILDQSDGGQQNIVDVAGNDEDGGSCSIGVQNYSNEANAVSQAPPKSFPLSEVNVDNEDGQGAEDIDSKSPDGRTCHNHIKTSNFMSQATVPYLTRDSSLPTTETRTLKDEDEPPAKKAKTNAASGKNNALESTSSDNLKPSDTLIANVDDVMGSADTANSADAKLSSLIHDDMNTSTERDGSLKPLTAEALQHTSLERQHAAYSCTKSTLSEHQEDTPSVSADFSTPAPCADLNPSEDSGYRDSNESSDGNEHDGSVISGFFSTPQKQGTRQHPLAPACNLCFIRKNLTTIWCELTSSIRTRTCNDDDSQLGIIDYNPTSAIDTEIEESKEDETEILLCLRPILEGGTVGEEFSFLHQKNKAITQEENSFVVDMEAPLTGTKSDTNRSSIKTFTPEEATLTNCESSKKTSKGTRDVSNTNIYNHQEEESVV
ncbi:hypothetical protein ACHAW6_004295 [Cyclotella cf. meneghiniana]